VIPQYAKNLDGGFDGETVQQSEIMGLNHLIFCPGHLTL
jgi:hypothetical protein